MNISNIFTRWIHVYVAKSLGKKYQNLIFLVAVLSPKQGVHLAVAHSPVAIGNFGGRLECVLMIAHGAIGNKMDNNIL